MFCMLSLVIKMERKNSLTELLKGLLDGKMYKCKKGFDCVEVKKKEMKSEICYGSILGYVREWDGKKHYVWMDEFNDICVRKRVV